MLSACRELVEQRNFGEMMEIYMRGMRSFSKAQVNTE